MSRTTGPIPSLMSNIPVMWGRRVGVFDEVYAQYSNVASTFLLVPMLFLRQRIAIV